MAVGNPTLHRYDQSEIITFLKVFQKKLLALNLPVDKVILYGSYARNQQTEQSDIDICILVPDALTELQDVSTKIRYQAYRTGRDMDIVVYRKTDYQKNKLSPLIHEIKKHGLDISK